MYELFKRKYRIIMKSIFYRFIGFNTWCTTPYSIPSAKDNKTSKASFDMNGFFALNQNRGSEADQWNNALKEINEIVQGGPSSSISLNKNIPPRDFLIDGNKLNRNNFVESLYIPQHTKGSVTLKNLAIMNLHVNIRIEQLVVIIDNCDISSFRIGGDNSPDSSAHLIVENTRIGRLYVGPKTINHLEMHGGCILDVYCPPADGENPFTGSVTFADVFFPRTTKHYLLRDEQPYRNLSAHLEKLNNTRMVHILHAAQLAVERKNDPRSTKLIGILYGIFSNYGSSTLRPIVWIFGLWFAAALFIWSLDGAVIALDKSQYIGWREKLVNPETSRIFQAMTLSGQEAVNPLGILRTKTLVIPRTTSVAFVGMLHSLFSTINIALFILAVRRRFKLQ